MSEFGEFPGGSVVKAPGFTAGGVGSIPGWGTKIPYTAWHGKKKKSEILGKLYLSEAFFPRT